MKTQQEQHEIELCGECISYQLEWKNVKNINLRMRPENGLTVSAHPKISLAQIEAVIREHGERILETLRQYAALQEKQQAQYPRQYIEGEPVLYLGKYYTLSVERSRSACVHPEKERLLLLTPDPENAAKRKQIFDTWWNTQCEKAVRNLCRAVYPIYQLHDIPFPEIRFRQMVSQWGNCRPSRKILTFNTRLLAAPVRCIEYVVIHEFTHFLYPNHSRAFYDFIAAELPDWKKLQETLQKFVQTRDFT